MTASMSVSRSLPGSSRTSTLGSSMSTHMRARRRRWPPERSQIRVESSRFSKPRLSSIFSGVMGLPSMTKWRRLWASSSETRQSSYGASASRRWSRMPKRTLSPILTLPADGRSLPVMRPRSVVLPAPFSPRIPRRSPGPMSQSMSWRTTLGPSSSSYAAPAPCISMTCLPRRAIARRLSSSGLRMGGTSAIMARASSMRNLGLLVRACAPRDSQANSLRRTLRRLLSATAAWRERSTRCWM